MAFWDRVRKLLSKDGEPVAAEVVETGAPAPDAAPDEVIEELELDLDAETDVVDIELLDVDPDPSSLDSIDAARHLEIPDLLDDDEVTELGVDPDKVRSRMRLSDPMFPDDEITEVTWLSEISPEAHTEEEEIVEVSVDEDPTGDLDEVISVVPEESEEETGEATLEVPDEPVEQTEVALHEPQDEPEATQAVVYEEPTGQGAPAESDVEVTDFHLDVFNWQEANTEDEAPAPALSLSNSLLIADSVVAQALSVEHYPGIEADVAVLHALARSDAQLLDASLVVGRTLKQALDQLDDLMLLEAAILWTSFRTDPVIRQALVELAENPGEIQLRALAWAALYKLPWIVVAAEEGCPEVLRSASEGLLDAYDDRITLLETHGLDDQPVDSQPLTPAGLHKLDGFKWLD